MWRNFVWSTIDKEVRQIRMKEFNINTEKGIEIGLYSLGDYMPDPFTGTYITEQQRIKEIIKAAQMAEDAGLDIFSLGESHQENFVSQAHQVILGAIAQATSNIKISSGVTVLSTADPVRTYEEFATLDLISNGRTELIAGRASRTGVYELMGIDLKDYEAIFEEKFELLLQLNREKVVNWSGKYRPPLHHAQILPRPLRGSLPIWRGVGGTPSSAIKAGRQGVPMTLATLAGPVDSFRYTVDNYRRSLSEAGYEPSRFPVAITSLCYVAEDTPTALREYYPYLNSGFQRSNGRPFPKYTFAASAVKDNALMVGGWELIVEKILYQYDAYGHQRFLAQIDFGGLPLDKVQKIIDLLANKVMPAVKSATKS